MIDCHCTEEDWTTMMLDGSVEKWEHQMRMKFVTDSDQYDKNLYNSRLKSEKDKNVYYDNLTAKALEPSPSVKCPYCQSTNTKKISTTSKAVHTAFFGLFSLSRNAKQWHCNQCGSDF